MTRSPICTSSPWCSAASRTRRPFDEHAVEAAVVGDHRPAAALDHERVAARHGAVVEDDVGGRAPPDPGEAAEREHDDLVAVGDREVAPGGEPPDGGGGCADAVQERPGAHDGGGGVGQRWGRRRKGHGGHVAGSSRSFPSADKEFERDPHLRAPSAAAVQWRAMKVLVVDDEPSVRQALERALALDHYEVRVGRGRARRARPPRRAPRRRDRARRGDAGRRRARGVPAAALAPATARRC